MTRAVDMSVTCLFLLTENRTAVSWRRSVTSFFLPSPVSRCPGGTRHSASSAFS